MEAKLERGQAHLPDLRISPACVTLPDLRIDAAAQVIIKRVQMPTDNKRQRHVPKAKLSRFAANLLEEWLRLDLPVSDETIVVAVSGGADSSALLLALDELVKRERLRLIPIAAHLDHGLREGSGADDEWVSELVKSLGYEVAIGQATLKTRLNKGFKTSTG